MAFPGLQCQRNPYQRRQHDIRIPKTKQAPLGATLAVIFQILTGILAPAAIICAVEDVTTDLFQPLHIAAPARPHIIGMVVAG